MILTDSQHSLYSIKLNYSNFIAEKEFYVLYPLTQLDSENALVSNKVNEEKFIMMISADRWIKNSYRGIMAIDDLYEKGLLNGVKTKVYGNAPDKIKKE